METTFPDAYFYIKTSSHHRPFLRFAFEGVAYQYTVLPFGLSLAPCTIKVTHHCVKAVAPWTTPRLFLTGVQLGMTSRRKVVMMDASSSGWDALYEGNLSFGRCNLHPQTVQMIWSVYGKAEVDLFASKDNCHCPIYFSIQRDALAQDWPNTHLYAFPPIALIPRVIRQVRETKCSLLLVVLLWRNQVWFPEMIQLLSAAPWPISLRRDLLLKAQSRIWQP